MTAGGALGPLFSLVTARRRLRARLDVPARAARAGRRRARAARARRAASCPRSPAPRPSRVRACARPISADGRPLLGPLPAIEGLFVATGHGPWGVSLGPGSARLVADAVLGRDRGDPAGARRRRASRRRRRRRGTRSAAAGARTGSPARAAAEGEQRLALRLGLDALGHHGQPERRGHRRDRLDQRRGARVLRHPGHERAVDLQRVEREALQVGQRRVAGAEVVEQRAGRRAP